MLGKEIVDQFENHAGGHRAHYWDARTTIIDPERSSADAVHELRRSMKQWRALLRLLEPVVCPQFL
jgi:CHAD domain-containing protein